jgi:hypothetical protein
MSAIREFRLRGPGFWVDVRLYQLNGRWLASADSPGGPTLRTGYSALAALAEALEPFEGAIGQLLESAPADIRFSRLFQG